jgi:ABC-type polysaccharide/polyol phosphate export permease
MTAIKNIMANFKKYKFLMSQLILRDFKIKYKRSVLGVVWSLLYPILMMAVMALVFSNMFRFQVEGVSYLVYLLTGIITFQYFSEASNLAMTSVVNNFTLINKVYIPKYIFPLAKCLFVGINFLLSLIPWFLIIVLTQFGLGNYPASINIYYLILPFIFVCLLLFTVGMGFFLSCVSVFLRDVFYIYGIVLTIWQYFTPIFYSIEIIPAKLQFFFQFNPIYQFLEASRTIVLYGQCPTALNLILCAVYAIIAMVVGCIVFKKNQDKFIYYI